MRGGWKRLRNLINRATSGKFHTVLSADWSQFDRRALFSVIDDVHEIWRSFFDMSGTYQPTNFYPDASTDPIRIASLWKWFTSMVKHYPIALPSGDLVQWTRNGIASGFQETQLLDSWVNGTMLLTCLSETGVDIEHHHFFLKLQGDDSLCVFSESFFRIYGKSRYLARLSEIAMRRFNAKLSVDKSDLHDRLEDVYVLGYFNRQGEAYRTDVDLLSHLLFPEREQGLGATAASAIGIAMAAQGCSRPVYDTCKDVFDYITNVLEYDIVLTKEGERKALYFFGVDPDTIRGFPEFTDTWLQNFVLEGRSESERQRTWPTDPRYTDGFYFL